jgi:hypothetical protein
MGLRWILLAYESLSISGDRCMGRTTLFPRKWSGVLVALLLLMVPLLLIACGGGEPTEVAMEPTDAPAEAAPTDAPTEAPPTEAPTEPPPTEAPTEPPPTEAPTEPPATDTPEPTPEPTLEPTPEVVDDTACIGCHTDQEALKLVAVEEEKPEVESEGEG